MSPENIQYLTENYYKYPISHFTEKFSRTKAYILNRASVLGITKLKPCYDADILADYKDNKTIKHIELKYRISRQTIKTLVESNNIVYRDKSLSRMSKKINLDYFKKIDTPNKAYFFGFLLADGCVHGTSFQMFLHKEDSYILQQFLADMGSTHILYTDKNSIGFRIANKHMVADLKKLGMYTRKTFNLPFPDTGIISDNLMHHFLRGYFDGDGSIQFHQYKYPMWRFTIMAPENFNKHIQEILLDKCQFKTGMLQEKRCAIDMKTLYASSTTGELGVRAVERIYNFLYEPGCMHLQRKKIIFEKIFNDSKTRQKSYPAIPITFNGKQYSSMRQCALDNEIPISTFRRHKIKLDQNIC